MKRILTALLLAPAAAALVLWAPPWAFHSAAGLIALLSYWEYSRLVERHGVAPPGPVGYAAGLLLLLAPAEIAWWLVSLLALLALTLALRVRPLAGALPRAAALLLGVVYIFGAWRSGLALRELDRWWLLFALAVNWVGDTAAYYAGRWFGCRKLAPEISPAKTWAGAVASAAAALVFGWAYARALWPSMNLPRVLMIAAACNLAGQVGDLAESALKRGAGVKDSGALFPGHGGCLDRTDSPLFTMPVLYGLLRWLG